MDTPTIFWAIGFPLWLFFVALGVGTVFAMTDSESIGFLVARSCFVGATVTLIAFCVYWIVASHINLSLAVILAALVGIVSIPFLVLTLSWIHGTEIKLSTRLYPADFPDPRNFDGVPSGALKVFFGSNLAWATRMPTRFL